MRFDLDARHLEATEVRPHPLAFDVLDGVDDAVVEGRPDGAGSRFVDPDVDVGRRDRNPLQREARRPGQRPLDVRDALEERFEGDGVTTVERLGHGPGGSRRLLRLLSYSRRNSGVLTGWNAESGTPWR